MTAQPGEKTLNRIRKYVQKYWQKSGTAGHPDPVVTEAVVAGLAPNVEDADQGREARHQVGK